MKIELFVSHSFEPCRVAERIWSEATDERRLPFAVVDINSAEGRERAEQLGIRLVPALAMNGRLIAVGVQSADEVRQLLDHVDR